MLKSLRSHFSRYSVLVLLCLFILALWAYLREAKVVVDQGISDNVEQLQKIFNHINDTAGIINFEHQKNYIDFLNVPSGIPGSEVGPMNLKYPKKWQGPYLDDNPTMQEKLYQIVRTKKGHFVVPGPGVKLLNGKIIGKDIIFGENTDINDLIYNKKELMYQGKPLAAPINVGD